MLRSQFIKKVLLAGGLAALPGSWVKVYDKYYLLQFFIAGFQFYNGPKLLSELGEGDMLELVREPDNKYDEYAIALHWNKQKVGFLPRHCNNVLAPLLDLQAVDIQAEITHLNKQAATWENVSAAVYLLKQRKSGGVLSSNAEKYTLLETPRYHSIKTGETAVGKISFSNEDDSIVVNVNSLPDEFSELKAKYSANQTRIEDHYFSEEGMRILSEEDVDMLLPRVIRVNSVIDDTLKEYTELVIV